MPGAQDRTPRNDDKGPALDPALADEGATATAVRQLRRQLQATSNTRIHTRGLEQIEKILADTAFSIAGMNNVQAATEKYPLPERQLRTSMKRAAQNRDSQRAFRQRRKARIEHLERIEALFGPLQQENEQLRAENERLRVQLQQLQQRQEQQPQEEPQEEPRK